VLERRATAATLTQALRPVLRADAVLSTNGKASYWKVAKDLKVWSGYFVSQYHSKVGNGPWQVQSASRYDSSLVSWTAKLRSVATK